MYIYGRNPVKEAYIAGKTVDKIFVQKGEFDPMLSRVLKLAKEARTVVSYVDKNMLDKLANGGNHQGIVAAVTDFSYCEVEDIINLANEKGEPLLIVILDGITDPHNLGAILRSAEALGVHGVIIPKRRSAGLSATAFRASSGAAAHIGVARVTNLAATLDQLKEYGLWVAGTAAGAPDCNRANLKGALALCIGSEGEGLAHLTEQKCDFMVGIPLKGRTESLNASCAASVLIYEVLRQRNG